MVYNCVSFSSNLRLAMDAFLKRVACAFVTFGLIFVLPIACKGGLLDDVEREIARDDANSLRVIKWHLVQQSKKFIWSLMSK